MPLAAGTRLGPYEIVAPLAHGGMGEVYRARDTRLDRAVAVKVLPGHLSEKSDLRERLQQEARTISKLTHPNICILHDVGHQEGMDFLVMELVEGQTLRQLMAPGKIPMGKTISLAVQIAEGLAHAHEAGIVHRDLKPENVMVTNEFVKILDFGLAKLADTREVPVESGATAGFQTDAGLILGTVEYMSPEQASGIALDCRSDQFSLGLVLYEMATGKRAFRRATQAQTLAAIIAEEPTPLTELNPEVPPPFAWVVERCLAKDESKRYASTKDLARELVMIRDRVSSLQTKRKEPSANTLPVSRTAFVGRENELAAAKALFLRPDVRLLTVTGPGGIGKSRLALELARDIADLFPAGVFFVPLAAVTDATSVPFAIAQALGLKETAEQNYMQALKSHLRDGLQEPLLILLDNFEHLTSAAPLLTELLGATPELRFLVSSRAALHVYDEHEFPVPPLALPDPRSLPKLEALSEYPAIVLFVQRAAAVKPDFVLTQENAPVVAEICARLDGLPLAIELAAARAKLLSPGAILARLAKRLQLLTGGPRDLPERQQTLRQAIDWSYDLLGPEEQKLFRRLSVFHGGCTLESVESVCDTKQDLGLGILDGMTSVVDKSLMQQLSQADGEPRFVMLGTLREYGAEKLAEHGEQAATRRSHAAYFLVVAEEEAAEDENAKPDEWTERFEIEHDNFRTALEFLIESGEGEWGLRLGAAMFRFWEAREYFSEGREFMAKLLSLKGASNPTKYRVRALFAAGVLAWEQGDYIASETLMKESIEIARKLEDSRSVAVSLNALAAFARDRGDTASARSLFEESLTLWSELKDSQAVARGLSNLANVAKLQGDFGYARTLQKQSINIFRELADYTGIAWTLNSEGDVARDQGESQAACALYEESLAAFRKLNDQRGVAGALADLGNASREQSEYSKADTLYRESLIIFEELDHKRGIARLLESFACSAAGQTRFVRALRLAGAAAALRQGLRAPLSPLEQAKLEKSLACAHEGLNTLEARNAWFEGWVMPMKKAIEDALTADAATM